ncbi:hypothetical protein ACSQ67_009210 [Phaseolus vulgaris]
MKVSSPAPPWRRSPAMASRRGIPVEATFWPEGSCSSSWCLLGLLCYGCFSIALLLPLDLLPSSHITS